MKVLIQSPAKFIDVVPIFCQECLKHNIFDGIYIATDFNDHLNLPSQCQVMNLAHDNQFSSNMLTALSKIKDDVILMCCEDHVMVEKHDHNKFQQAYDFISARKDIGVLRLTYNDRIKFVTKDASDYNELHKKYQYYVSCQPSFWRRKHLINILKDGEDAWAFELNGSKRAAKSSLKSYCVKETIFHATNFFKSGKHYRHYFIDYAVKNEMKMRNRNFSVFYKHDGLKEILSIDEYLKRTGQVLP